MFDHEMLEVYRVAIELVGVADDIGEQLPRGRGKLADQLSRAVISVPLNIAEGAGLWASGEKQRAYRIARGSAMECAAIMDVCMILKLSSPEKCHQCKELLERVVSMLSKLIQTLD
mgnify:CR=1 FL=1